MRHRTYVARTIEEIVRVASRRGWVVTTTGGGHLRFTHPDGGLVFAARTPSDWRATRKVAAELQRQEEGFDRTTQRSPEHQ